MRNYRNDIASDYASGERQQGESDQEYLDRMETASDRNAWWDQDR